jgi:hypothetical protein
VVFLSIWENIGIVPRLGQNLSLPNSFQVIYQPSFHLTLDIDSVDFLMVVEMSQLSRCNDGLEGRGSLSGRVKRFFYLHCIEIGCGGPPKLLSSGNVELFHREGGGVKRPGLDGDYLPMFSAEIENSWSHISIPFICLHGL